MSRRTAALLAAALTTALTGPLLLGTASPAAARPEVDRIAGENRYETAVAVSRTSRPDGADVVVLTTGTNFPDALAGGAAAASLDAPVLLTAPDSVPSVVLAELERLDPERVLLLGGTGAVSEAAEDQLAGYVVERIAGAGRYETAALVSETAFAAGVPVAYVATGTDFPDALAGAAAAGRDGGPVLLTAKDELPEATADELARLRPQRLVVLGGPGAVSDEVEEALAEVAPTTRVAGADRYATAAALAATRSEVPPTTYLATGTGFADALSGGPAAALAGAPVLLVRSGCLPEPAEALLDRYGDAPVVLLGGPAVLGAGVVELRPCRRVPDGPLATGVRLDTLDDPRGPWKGKIVSVAPEALGLVDVVLAQDELPGLEPTTAMARRTGALVAVNGDFALPGGRPVHAFAKDGRLLQTPQVLGRNVAVETSTNTPHLGFPNVDARVDVPSQDTSVPVAVVNSGAARADALALTTAEGVGVPQDEIGCAAALRPVGAPVLFTRTVQQYSVVAVDCTGGDLDTELDLLTAVPGGRAEEVLAALSPGEEVSYSWTVGWPDVLDTIGGNPTLLEDGAVVAGNVDGTDAFSKRNPRTAVGYRADGTLLIVTVDGRGAQGSVGMSLRELASLFARLGASDALNLDGGGSTAMVVGGELQNVPSDGPERPVSSALLLRAPATGAALRTSPPAPRPLTADQLRAGQRAQTDPGSTGGLLAR